MVYKDIFKMKFSTGTESNNKQTKEKRPKTVDDIKLEEHAGLMNDLGRNQMRLRELICCVIIKMQQSLGIEDIDLNRNIFWIKIDEKTEWTNRFILYVLWSIHHNLADIITRMTKHQLKKEHRKTYNDFMEVREENRIIEEIINWLEEYEPDGEIENNMILFHLMTLILDRSFKEQKRYLKVLGKNIELLDKVSSISEVDNYLKLLAQSLILLEIGHQIDFDINIINKIRTIDNYYALKESVININNMLKDGVNETEFLHPMFKCYLESRNYLIDGKFMGMTYTKYKDYALVIYGIEYLIDVFNIQNESLRLLRQILVSRKFQDIAI